MSDSIRLTVGGKGAESLGFAPAAQAIEHRRPRLGGPPACALGLGKSDIVPIFLPGRGGTPVFAPRIARAPLSACFDGILGFPSRDGAIVGGRSERDGGRVWA